MSKASDEYQKALLKARNESLGLNAEAQKRLLDNFRESLKRIPIDSGKAIDPKTAKRLEKQIRTIMDNFQTVFENATKKGIDVTIDEVIKLHDNAIQSIADTAGVKLSHSFEGVNDAVYRGLAKRRGAATFQSLLNKPLSGSIKEIDSFIQSAVTRGVATNRATVDLARLMAGNDPALLAAVNRVPANSKVHAFGGYGKLDFERYGINPNQVKAVRKIYYDARRIMISETNNALREANAEALVQSPVISAAQWTVSGRHKEEDECDILAKQDVYGFGPGFYPAEFWPPGPHPHCGCYHGKVKQRLPTEWKKPKTPPTPMDTAGRKEIENTLEQVAKKNKWTDARISRARGTVVGGLRDAENEWASKIGGKKQAAKKSAAAAKHKEATKAGIAKKKAAVEAQKAAEAAAKLAVEQAAAAAKAAAEAAAKVEAEKAAAKLKHQEATKAGIAKKAAAKKAAEAAAISKPALLGKNETLDSADILHQKVGEAAGSNAGGFYVGKDGVKRYVKFYDDRAQAFGEHLSNGIYRELGYMAPKSLVFEHNGKFAFASEVLEVEGTIGSVGLTKARANQILNGFAGDVLTANWDAVGTGLDNIVVLKNGGIARIDQGGTFLMRAKQGRKPLEFLDQITEWDQFANASTNPYYSKVFKAAGVANANALGMNLVGQIDEILALEQGVGGWAKYVDEITTFRDSTGKLIRLDSFSKDRIVQMLEERTKLLKIKRDSIESMVKAPVVVPAPTAASAKLTKQVVAAPILPFPADLAGLQGYISKQKTIVAFRTARENVSKFLDTMPWRDPLRTRIQSMLDTVQSWQSGSHASIRKSIATWIESERAGTHLGGATNQAYRDLATLIDHADPALMPKTVYRGFSMFNMSPDDYIAHLAGDGNIVDLGLSSFSTKTAVADKFGGRSGHNRTSVRLIVKGKYKGLGVQQFGQSSSYHGESEWIVGGRFRVTKITKLNERVEVELEQIATFAPGVPKH